MEHLKVKRILGCVYTTVEEEKEEDGKRMLFLWYTDLSSMTSTKEWVEAPPKRADGFNILHKKGDEIITFICELEDGQSQVAVFPADLEWTHEEMWKNIESMKESLLSNSMVKV